ncbi:MAG: hypothetical protein ACXWN2_09730, partial [Candidatus Limnocylindrales bacterium]
ASGWLLVLVLSGFPGGAAYPPAVAVYNLGHAQVTYTWQAPGLFGTPILGSSGSGTIGPCGSWLDDFRGQEQQISITTQIDQTSYVLHQRAYGGEAIRAYLIDATGHITTKADPGTLPTETCEP